MCRVCGCRVKAQARDVGKGAAGVSVDDAPQLQQITIVTNIRTKTDQFAGHDQGRLKDADTFAVNLVSSPGAGKTTLLRRTVRALRPQRIAMIEYLGNRARPAAFDQGEDCKVAILSVTEGADQPLKHPEMFTGAKLAILNKSDLAPTCGVNLAAFTANLRRVNPQIEILPLSAHTGEGVPAWLAWLRGQVAAKLRGLSRDPKTPFQIVDMPRGK